MLNIVFAKYQQFDCMFLWQYRRNVIICFVFQFGRCWCMRIVYKHRRCYNNQNHQMIFQSCRVRCTHQYWPVVVRMRICMQNRHD